MPEREVKEFLSEIKREREALATRIGWKMIRDLEEDILRIENKIAAICCGHGRDADTKDDRGSQNAISPSVYVWSNKKAEKLAVPTKVSVKANADIAVQRPQAKKKEQSLHFNTIAMELASIHSLTDKIKHPVQTYVEHNKTAWDIFISERTNTTETTRDDNVVMQAEDNILFDEVNDCSDCGAFVNSREHCDTAMVNTTAVSQHDCVSIPDFSLVCISTEKANTTTLVSGHLDNTDDEWGDFVKARATLKVVVDEESERSKVLPNIREEATGLLDDVDDEAGGDAWQGFFKDQMTVNGSQEKQKKKKRVWRKLNGRMFGQ